MQIVAASIAQLDADVAESLGIHILDYPLLVNGQERQASVADPPELQADHRAVIADRANRCSTSSMSEGQLLALYEQLKDAPFLSMHQGERFSNATWATLRKVERERPDLPARVVDTHHTLSGYTVLLLQAARAMQDGRSWESYEPDFYTARQNTTNIAVVYDLFYLSRTGRISFAKAMLGTALRAIPLLIFRDDMDGAQPYGRVRTYAQANLRIVQTMERDLARVGGNRMDLVLVTYGPRDEERAHLLDLIQQRGWEVRIDGFVGKHIAAAHLGPDYWEVGYTVHAD